MATVEPTRPRAAAAASAAAPTGHVTAVYSRVTAFGLLLIGLAPLLMLAVGVATGLSMSGDAGFLGAVAVVPLVAAALAWRFAAWSQAVGLLVAVLAAFGLSWMAFGLAFPAAFGDFVPGVTFLLGMVLTVAGSVAALGQERRGNRAATATPAERSIMLGTASVVAAAAALSAVLTVTTGISAAAADDVAVDMADFEFVDASYEVAAGEPVTLQVHNRDGFVHDIAIPALGIDPIIIPPNGDAVVEIDRAPAGAYPIYCTLHSNTEEPDPARAGMAAMLTVR